MTTATTKNPLIAALAPLEAKGNELLEAAWAIPLDPGTDASALERVQRAALEASEAATEAREAVAERERATGIPHRYHGLGMLPDHLGVLALAAEAAQADPDRDVGGELARARVWAIAEELGTDLNYFGRGQVRRRG